MAKRPPSNQRPTGASKPAGLATLLHKIENILTTDDASFKGLASAAGLDPKKDFRGIYLNGIPLADQDISGFDFSEFDLRNTGVERAKRDRTTKFEFAIFDGKSLDPDVYAFNRRLLSMQFSEIERELTKAVASGRRKFDVVSFETAIRKAPSGASAAHWYEEMQRANIAPSDRIFNMLINKAETEEGEARWYSKMQDTGIKPNVITFTTLIKKSKTERDAVRWYEEMQKSGVAPNAFTLSTLINKSETEELAVRWYQEMRKSYVAPNDITFATLMSKATS